MPPAVCAQLKERERIADEERQVGERRQVMEELQRRSDALLAEQQAWAAKQVGGCVGCGVGCGWGECGVDGWMRVGAGG